MEGDERRVRLIDADELRWEYCKECYFLDLLEQICRAKECNNSATLHLDEAPTIEAIPVEWIKRYLARLVIDAEEEERCIIEEMDGYGTNYSLLYMKGIKRMLEEWKEMRESD